jgi:hypothetical protein
VQTKFKLSKTSNRSDFIGADFTSKFLWQISARRISRSCG